MLIILSPAKTQDFESPAQTHLKSEPRFKKQSLELLRELKKYSPADLKKLMSVSENIADLNYRRFQEFDEDFKSGKQAILTFKGDVYRPIQVDRYTEEDFEFAQKHIRILSGFYGLLSPLDTIQPYRLEMKTKLKNSQGKDLYPFWGNELTKTLQIDLKNQGDEVLINLASNEYSKALDLKNFKGKIITPVFLEKRDQGEPRMIALFAKKARGMMTDFVIKNHLKKPEALKKFNTENYRYSEKLSDEKEWVFIR